MSKHQERFQKLLDNAVDSGRELGLQLAVYHHGELVVNVWSGIASRATGQPVEANTLFPVFSTSKGLGSTIINRLLDQGAFELDDPIAKYWPEFAQNDKDGITIRHALNHTSGLAHMPTDITNEDVINWDRMVDAVAKLKPRHAPGEREEYHAITFGWIIGELAHRVDGRPLDRILTEDICTPLGIADDMFLGTPEEAERRIAFLEEPEPTEIIPGENGPNAIPQMLQPLVKWMNTKEARQCCNTASCGVMSAHAAARMYAALLPGGIKGVELLSPEQIELATTPTKLNNGETTGRGLGYILGSEESVYGPTNQSFGHGGYGGSNAYADPANHLAVGLTKNLYTPQFAHEEILREVRAVFAG